MKKIPIRWILAGGVIYLALMAALSMILLFPQNLRIKELKTKLHSDNPIAPEAAQKEKDIAALRKDLKNTRAILENRLAVPEKTLLTRVLGISDKARIKVLSVVPSGADAANPGGGPVIKIVFTGSYRQIVDFVHLLESDRVLFRIQRMTLGNAENVHHGEADVVAYAK